MPHPHDVPVTPTQPPASQVVAEVTRRLDLLEDTLRGARGGRRDTPVFYLDLADGYLAEARALVGLL